MWPFAVFKKFTRACLSVIALEARLVPVLHVHIAILTKYIYYLELVVLHFIAYWVALILLNCVLGFG